MRIVTTILCAVLLGIASVAGAEEIQPGARYDGPKRLGISSIGVSFTLPSGWVGTLPAGEESFIAGRADLTGNIFIIAQQASAEAAKAEMSKPLNMPPVSITPKGEPKVSGDRITNTYTVTGGAAPLEGHAVAKIGTTGWSVMVLAIAPAAEMPAFIKGVEAMIGSVKIEKPKVPKASVDGHWGKALAGKRVIRFHTVTGYSEKQQIALCPNGRFVYNFEGGGTTVNGSGAMLSNNGGVWTASGTAGNGVLNLRYNDGRTAQYSLSESDGKLMVDGSRWFREPVNCN